MDFPCSSFHLNQLKICFYLSTSESLHTKKKRFLLKIALYSFCLAIQITSEHHQRRSTGELHLLLVDSISPNEIMMSDMIAKQEGARLFLTPASVARKANRYFIILLTLQVYVMYVFCVLLHASYNTNF